MSRLRHELLHPLRLPLLHFLQRITQGRADARRARDGLAKTRIEAPIAGVVTRLNSEIGAILRDPDTVKWLATQAAEPVIAAPEAFRKRIADDIAKWSKVAKAAGMKVD